MLFNLYVADLQKKLDCPCYQYADDTTFFLHTKVAALGTCVNDMNRATSRLGKHSSDSNLALNEHKTKWMLLSTKQMARAHSLQTASVNISCSRELGTCEKHQTARRPYARTLNVEYSY